jgi:hypothetical protein
MDTNAKPMQPEPELDMGELVPVRLSDAQWNYEPCPGCGARVRLGGVTCYKCWPEVPEHLRDAWLRADGFRSDEKSTRAVFRHFGKEIGQVQARRNFPVLTQGPEVAGLLRASPYYHADERHGGRKIECPGCLGLMGQDNFVCPPCVKARTALLDAVLYADTLAQREECWSALLLALRAHHGQPPDELPTFADCRGYDPVTGAGQPGFLNA